jgi:hypothetical protein
MTRPISPTLEKRYLELLRRALLNEIYFETEVRLLYVFMMLQSKKAIDTEALRNLEAHYLAQGRR